jgi:hypothetical protein
VTIAKNESLYSANRPPGAQTRRGGSIRDAFLPPLLAALENDRAERENASALEATMPQLARKRELPAPP